MRYKPTVRADRMNDFICSQNHCQSCKECNTEQTDPSDTTFQHVMFGNGRGDCQNSANNKTHEMKCSVVATR